MTPEELEGKLAELQRKTDGVLSLLRKILDPDGKITLNMKIEDLVVYVANKGQVAVNVDTSSADGKILFCALSPRSLNRQTFTIPTLQKALLEESWNMASKTIYNNVYALVSRGLLIKEDQTYRLPAHVTFIGDALKEAV
jgi:hypothetical protein